MGSIPFGRVKSIKFGIQPLVDGVVCGGAQTACGYGKDDVGGTSILYLSHVPFEKLGLEDLGTDPVPMISEQTSSIVLPTIFVGGPLILAAIRYINKRGGWEDSWPL